MVYDQRLPAVNGDDGSWGNILNQYLQKEHYDTGLNDPANGGHKTITILAGTSAANTAPIRFTSGPLMTTPQTGAIEFLTDRLYFTQTNGITRKTFAIYNDALGAGGDLYYRDTNGNFTRLGVGSDSQVLTASSGLPTWQSLVGVINNMDGGAASTVYGGAVMINGGGA
jgi:hypothetical protein